MKVTQMVASCPRVPVNYRKDLALRLEGKQGMITQNRTPEDRVSLVTAPRSNSPFQGCHLRCHSIPFGRVPNTGPVSHHRVRNRHNAQRMSQSYWLGALRPGVTRILGNTISAL